MKMIVRGCLAAATAAAATIALVSPVQAASGLSSAAGTWDSGPDQTYTDTISDPLPGPTSYKTAVRPPVNADGSSNFTAKRGVIPIQFDVLAATSTTTTTTRHYTAPVWESIASDSDPGNDSSYAGFVPATPIPLSSLTTLSANYVFSTGNCHGGSLRWSISLDWTGDGVRDGGAWVYYGDGPNFTDCTTNSQSGTNMRSLTDLRVDTSNAGGTFYDSWAGLTALHPDATVLRASLVMDSGWAGDQRADVSNVTVNDNTWVPKTSEVIDTSTTTGAFAKTCALPAGAVKVYKADNTATGAINETMDSVQLKDTGTYFRQVDCKYIYNLDVSTLSGVGTYQVYANIGGSNVIDPAAFDLR